MKNEKVKETLEDFVKDFINGSEDLMIDIMAKKIVKNKR